VKIHPTATETAIMDEADFKGQQAVVVGAAGGIGHERGGALG